MEGQDENPTKSSQDAMRSRVRLFAEGVVKMVSPVLLVLALRKVELKDEVPWLAGSISPMATLTMAFGILLMVFLWLCISKLVEKLEWLQYAAYKLLVHLCAFLLMCLASVILLLISMNYQLWVMGFAFPIMGAVILSLYFGLRSVDGMPCCDRELENSVDFSAAFTVLLFLGLEHLALEMQQISNSKWMADDHLKFSLGVSFVTCVLGVAIMFVWTVPPPTRIADESMVEYIETSNQVLALLIIGIVLCITLVPLKWKALLVITPPFISILGGMYIHCDDPGEQDQTQNDNPIKRTSDDQLVDIEMQEQMQAGQPAGQLLQANQESDHKAREHNWIKPAQDDHIVEGHHPEGVQLPQEDGNLGDQHSDIMEDRMQAGVQHPPGEPNLTANQPLEGNRTGTQSPSPPDASVVKPPSLELTKFVFAGFLAVSIPSISKSSFDGCSKAFVLLSATSVISALAWRLLSHKADPSPVEISAANIASSFAHATAIAALVPFALMAGI